MAKHIIVAVRDRQLNAYMRPFVAQTKGQAIRSFSDEVNRAGSELNTHPEDYELYQLGIWDEDTGCITDTITAEGRGAQQLAIASNLLERSNNQDSELQRKRAEAWRREG